VIDPIDEDERQQLLRELLLERFGPIPYWEATVRPRKARRSMADRRPWRPGQGEHRRAA
jgi:hypothetical protein